MTDVHAVEIDSFQHGRRRLMRVTAPGTATHQGKAGPVELPFAAGDVLLADADETIIVGPVGLQGAVELAERILEGDQRAITDPQAMLALATAIVGFAVPAEQVPA